MLYLLLNRTPSVEGSTIKEQCSKLVSINKYNRYERF
jgi:hypothetical protein